MGFDPITMAIAGTAISAVGGIAGGQSAAAAGKANNQIAQIQAGQIEDKAAADLQLLRDDARKYFGGLNADVSAQGGSLDSASGLLFAEEAARRAKLDEMNLWTGAARQASGVRHQGQLAEWQGKQQRTQGFLGALGTALSGGARAWGMSQGYS